MRAAIQDLGGKCVDTRDQLERIAYGDTPKEPEAEPIDPPAASP
jgi:hypothetical protein